MAVKVTVNSSPSNRISINNQQREIVRTVGVGSEAPTRVSVNNQQRETIRTVGVGIGIANPSISTLSDVDATSKNDNDTLIYDAARDKFVVKALPTLPTLNGGTF